MGSDATQALYDVGVYPDANDDTGELVWVVRVNHWHIRDCKTQSNALYALAERIRTMAVDVASMETTTRPQ